MNCWCHMTEERENSREDKLSQQFNDVESNLATSLSFMNVGGPLIINNSVINHMLSFAEKEVTPSPGHSSKSKKETKNSSDPFVLPPYQFSSNLVVTNSMVETTHVAFEQNSQEPQLEFSPANEKPHRSSAPDKDLYLQKRKFGNRKSLICKYEEIDNDRWTWRKYGQKSIKGNTYPRSYYKCSTMKGCHAKKQVERSPNDPDMYIVTYTFKHDHARPSEHVSMGWNRSRHYAGSEMDPQPLPEIPVEEIEPQTNIQPEIPMEDPYPQPVEAVPAQTEPNPGSWSGMSIDRSQIINPRDGFESRGYVSSNKDNNENQESSDDGSARSGVTNEGVNKEYDILIPNPMADWDLWTALEPLSLEENRSNRNSNSIYCEDNSKLFQEGYDPFATSEYPETEMSG